MRQHDMEHLKWLLPVAAADVTHLEMKEATYQGSWKRSGGRSAWFMLRRKIDRLLEMMKRPEEPHGWNIQDYFDAIDAGVDEGGEVTVDASIAKYLATSYEAENVFAMIRKDPSGSDGSVLAEVRDLRRYLLLVEAEMISRGVVTDVERAHGKDPALAMTYGTTDKERSVPRYVAQGDPQQTPFLVLNDDKTTTLVRGTTSFAEREAFKGLEPWLVLKEVLDNAPDHDGEMKALDNLYDDHGAGLMKLTPALIESQWFNLTMVVSNNTSVASSLISRALECYVAVEGEKVHVLDVSRAPADYRSAWPRLRSEYNAMEYSTLEPWQRALYEWIEGQTKWRMRAGLEPWKGE